MTDTRLALAVAALPICLAGAAEAGLEFCNDTGAVQSVSVAYVGPNGWVSRGWWNIDPGTCQVPIADDLVHRYYLYRTEVSAGAFEGDGYLFCTSPQVYTIEGREDCAARGYDTEDFRLIDTGGAAHYTFRLDTQTGAAGADAPPPAEGLSFCNETPVTQSVAVGYYWDDNWISEGWWNIGAGECAPVLNGPLNGRYFYYRAEVEGGGFDGEGYYFCTSPEAFTVVGDADCAGRGYDEEDFAEIDIGDYEAFVVTLVDDTAPPPRDTAPPPAETRPAPTPDAPPAESNEAGEGFPTFDRKATPRPPRGN